MLAASIEECRLAGDRIPHFTLMSRIEQVHTLQEKLTVPAQLTFRKNAYWYSDEGRSFWSLCWDADHKLVRLDTQQGYYPQCLKCDHVAADPDQPPPKPVVRRRSNFLRRDRY
jgi:hypothetical protein